MSSLQLIKNKKKKIAKRKATMRSLQSDSSWRVRNLPGCHQLNWSRRNSAETLAGLASELTPRRIADSTIAGSALDRPCGNYARHGGDIRLM